MIKNFPAWHAIKQRIDNAAHALRGYKERDVWWVSVGHNVGFEEEAKGTSFSRPVLVVKGFSQQIFWGIPLTSKRHTGKYYYLLTVRGQTMPSIALLSQLSVFDTKRMTTKHGTIEESDFMEIKRQLRSFLR
jgi:mRNA interferase MazF